MQQPQKQEQSQKLNENIEQEQQQQQQVTGKNKAVLNQKLLTSVKKNQYQQVEKCLKRKADINYQENTKKKWNSLIWSCCQGSTNIAKLLLTKGAGQQYIQVKMEYRHVPIGSTKQLRPNPLHWASFKNHQEIVEILLKAGFHWQEVDGSGNNSVMLAAAGAAPQIFKVFLQYGVTLEDKNSRGHTVKDLTTQAQILRLVTKNQKAKECYISKQLYKQKQIKYWCWVCDNFVNGVNYKMQWVLRTLKSSEKQKIDGRCKLCWNKNEQVRNQLQQAIKQYDQKNLKNIIQKHKDKHNQIQITFLEQCLKIAHKLSVQNNILAYIKSLNKVQDYKIILKSVNKIKKLLKGNFLINKIQDAQQFSIDHNVISIAQKQIQRLNTERNLRFQIDNIDTSVATREGVVKLETIYNNAVQKSVSTEYLEVAEQIKSKMKRSIQAQDIYQSFIDYPVRPDPYPEPLVIDFKTKKPLDPQTKKPTDPANLLPKKKKGNKKTPNFEIPEWAENLNDLNEKIKQLEELLISRQQLGLSQDFCTQAIHSITLMKKQSRYRKDINTLQAMVDEATKKKK